MADDGFGDGFGLRLRGTVLGQQLERLHAALEFKGELGFGLVVLGRADVVHETGKEVSFRAVAPVGEVLHGYCLAWVAKLDAAWPSDG